MYTFQPVAEPILVEGLVEIPREPFGESRYEIKRSYWDLVADEIEETIQLIREAA